MKLQFVNFFLGMLKYIEWWPNISHVSMFAMHNVFFFIAWQSVIGYKIIYLHAFERKPWAHWDKGRLFTFKKLKIRIINEKNLPDEAEESVAKFKIKSDTVERKCMNKNGILFKPNCARNGKCLRWDQTKNKIRYQE